MKRPREPSDRQRPSRYRAAALEERPDLIAGDPDYVLDTLGLLAGPDPIP